MNIYKNNILQVKFQKINSTLPENLNPSGVPYTIDQNQNMLRIDLSDIKDRNSLIKDLYDRYGSNIISVEITKLSFKDSLKYFLKDQINGE